MAHLDCETHIGGAASLEPCHLLPPVDHEAVQFAGLRNHMAQTEILKINPANPEPHLLAKAAEVIQRGGLVAFPTETVYGLGGDATNPVAIARIFEAKGRPTDNPLIVHVADRQMLDEIAAEIPDKAARVIERFWPGPLTVVLRRGPALPASVSAGLNTVAARMPSAPTALALIRAAARPIAAPSANASGRPSPTCAEHVLEDLDGKVDLILDGGSAAIGIESTVIDMTVDPPVILRPGWITREAIGEVAGPVRSPGSRDELRRSPGTRHKHYSPRARVILIERGSSDFIARICRKYLKQGRVGYMGHSATGISDPGFDEIVIGPGLRDYAASIYAGLRRLDQGSPEVIVVEGIDTTGEGEAVMDRLRRAASEVIIE